MKKSVAISIVGLMLVIALFVAAGFDIVVDSDIPLYASQENIPFAERSLAASLRSGDRLQSLGCFDNKSDIFFHVALQDGTTGYLYDFKFTAGKRMLPGVLGLQHFLRDPVASLQCLIMVPEYARR
jgi:hypothetical protein